jgi:phage terminase small subunit
LKDWNSTEAALRAGYSERNAHWIGAENIVTPAIAAEIVRRVTSRDFDRRPRIPTTGLTS